MKRHVEVTITTPNGTVIEQVVVADLSRTDATFNEIAESVREAIDRKLSVFDTEAELRELEAELEGE